MTGLWFPLLFFPSLLIGGCHIAYPPVTQELSSSPGLLINNGEWSFVGCFTSSQQKDGICLDLCMSGHKQLTNNFLLQCGDLVLLPVSVFWLRGLDMQRVTGLSLKG